MDNSAAATVCRRLEQMKADRSRHEPVWRSCYEHTHPMRSHGFENSITDAQEADKKQADLIDTTGTEAAELLASNIVSGMTPASSVWFEMDTGAASSESGAEDLAKRWLSNAARLLWTNIHASNFDAESLDAIQDAVDAGWFVLYVEEAQGGGFKFECWPLSECFIASSVPGGRVDIVYRQFELSAMQAVEKYGADNLSEKTAKLAQDKPHDKVLFVHAIEPRKVSVVGARMAKNLPVSSRIIEVGQKRLVKESGYHEMPAIVPRWTRIPGGPYGLGQAFKALPAMRQINAICRMELAALDLSIAGMWIAEDDGVLNPRTVKVGPRRIIVANSVDSMKPLVSGSDFNVTFSKIEQIQAQIRKIMMADQLQPQDGPAMTATEIHVRVGLIRQLLGPIYGRLQAEYLQPLIERCFGLMYRAGVLGQAPESLQGRGFTVRYIGPLARAQKLEDVTAIERLYTTAGAMVQASGDMSLLDNVDHDAALREIAEDLGTPANILRAVEDRDAMRENRAQAQQDAQQQQQVAAMAQSAGDAAFKRAAAA